MWHGVCLFATMAECASYRATRQAFHRRVSEFISCSRGTDSPPPRFRDQAPARAIGPGAFFCRACPTERTTPLLVRQAGRARPTPKNPSRCSRSSGASSRNPSASTESSSTLGSGTPSLENPCPGITYSFEKNAPPRCRLRFSLRRREFWCISAIQRLPARDPTGPYPQLV